MPDNNDKLYPGSISALMPTIGQAHLSLLRRISAQGRDRMHDDDACALLSALGSMRGGDRSNRRKEWQDK